MHSSVSVRPATQSVAIFIDVGESDSTAVVLKNALHFRAAVAVKCRVTDLYSALIHDDSAAGSADPRICADIESRTAFYGDRTAARNAVRITAFKRGIYYKLTVFKA